MGNKTRTFGGKDDVNFWADKPIQRGHPKFKEKWYHIHRYNRTENVDVEKRKRNNFYCA